LIKKPLSDLRKENLKHEVKRVIAPEEDTPKGYVRSSFFIFYVLKNL
jgi:hypothetical protein